MRIPLRGRILLLAVVAPAVLAVGTSWHLQREAENQARRQAHDSMVRTALVLDQLLAERVEALAVAAAVIARDPRFFAAVALPGGARNPQVRATVRGVAVDFAALTHAELFEVLDANGRLIASVNGEAASAESRRWLEEAVRHGEPAQGLIVDGERHFIAVATPVRADRRPVGALVLGSAIGAELANELEVLTRSEVTFVSGGRVTASTLERETDRARVADLLAGGPSPDGAPVAVDADGDRLLTLVRPLPGAGAGGQWVVLQRSLAAETAFLGRAQGALLGLALAAILAALVFGVWTSGRITGPLRQLVRGAEAMERGDYEAPIEVASRDEIGYLSTRFREMRTRERDYVRSLEEVGRIKSEFINVASHELRTPITVIKGYHDLFHQGALGPVTPDQERALSAIEQSLGGLIRITEDAECIAEMSGERLILHRGDHDLATLVTEAVEQATRDAAGRRVAVEIEVDDHLPPIDADGPRLAHAIANLVRNGIRFTPDGGEVRVTARAPGRAVEIVVEDTGVGIPADKRPHLFERAFMVRGSSHHHSSRTLEFNSAGLGLGLAIARGIVEAHDGTIDLEERPGPGSRFTIRIPEALTRAEFARAA
jgi:signal transduction histidine kinase